MSGRRSAGLYFIRATAVVLATSPLSTVFAADTDTPQGHGSTLEEITVQAQRSSEQLAREAQKEAPNLINIVTTESMRKLPDVNTGEAIRRVSGISLETDTGEGRYINIRGLDADLNGTTCGGLRLPPTNNATPFGAFRAVAFDSIPIGFIGGVTFDETLRDEKEVLDSKVFAVGGKNEFGGRVLDYHVGYTRGSYHKPYDLNPDFQSGGRDDPLRQHDESQLAGVHDRRRRSHRPRRPGLHRQSDDDSDHPESGPFSGLHRSRACDQLRECPEIAPVGHRAQ